MQYSINQNTTSNGPNIRRFDDIEARLTAAAERDILFRSREFSEVIAAKLDGLLEPGRDIVSLDVFDTLILRDNSSEITRFFEIGGRMAEIVNRARADRAPVAQVDAFLARHLGTKATYRASRAVNGCREGSLTEIHRTASCILTDTDRFTEDFITAELSYEASRITPNRLLLDYVARYRERGGQVLLLTDTYKHKAHVERLLAMLGIPPDSYDQLISSADTKVSKASGGIFEIAEDIFDAPPERFLHLGDSLRGDFARPRERGWRSLLLPLPEAEILERRRDHLRTANILAENHGITVDIAMPK